MHAFSFLWITAKIQQNQAKNVLFTAYVFVTQTNVGPFSSTSNSVIINAERKEGFQGEGGIKQRWRKNMGDWR